MGNWPSINSETESSASESDPSLDSDDVQDASDQGDEQEDDDEEEEVRNLCESEKSYFSEEEILPLVDEDSSNDEIMNSFRLPENDVNLNNLGHYKQPTARHADDDEIDLRCDDDVNEEDDDSDDEAEYDIDQFVQDDDSDGPSSLPVPPPSSPHYPALSQQADGSLPSVAQCQTDNEPTHLSQTGQDDLDGRAMVEEEIIVLTERQQEEESVAMEPRVVAWEIDIGDIATSRKAPKKKASSNQSKLKAKSSKGRKEEKASYVPPSVSTTRALIAQRKCLDLHRWYCVSRPQYSKSCGLSSLVSCWNYLFTSLGGGTLPPITQEEALTALGFKPPFGEIRFGPFTGNATLMRWFKQLNDHYGVRGRAYYQYKPHGRGRTVGRTSAEGLHLLKQGLQDPNMAFIYHCYNHYFCPVGFEDVPLKAVDAYRDPLNQDEVETWILIGDTSRKHPGIHCFKWEDISTDLNCQSPEYLNIRKLSLGVQRRKTKKTGGNLHCIMAFCRSAGFLTRKSKTSQEKLQESAAASSSGKRPESEGSSSSKTRVKVEPSTGGSGDNNTGGSGGTVRAVGTIQSGGHSKSKKRRGVVGDSKSCSNTREWHGHEDTTAARATTSDPQVATARVLPGRSSSEGGGAKKVWKKKGIESDGRVKANKSKKLKSASVVDRDVKDVGEMEVDLVEGMNLHDVGIGQSPRDCPDGPGAEEKENLDKVSRFLEDVSTQFGLSLDDTGAERAAALKEAMHRSENPSSCAQESGNQDNWVDLGQSADQAASRSSTGDVSMALSDFRAMNEDTYREVSVKDSEETDGREEVSDLAKHLIDQYIVSIIESISVKDEGAGNG